LVEDEELENLSVGGKRKYPEDSVFPKEDIKKAKI